MVNFFSLFLFQGPDYLRSYPHRTSYVTAEFSPNTWVSLFTIDLLPNYGPGTSKRYRKPVTTDNTVISNCEKRNFRRSSDLAEGKIYLFAVLDLVIFDMRSTDHSFGRFAHKSA